MNRNSTPIVVVAYNRVRSLKRLLGSLQKANYPSQNIDLIISIDKAENNQDVLAIANEFVWEFGVKKVNYQSENLGLRSHILQCGNLSQTYGSVLVLEDDLYVAPNFYEYATQALIFSEDKPYVAGISLYNHQFNIHTYNNFTCLEDGYDNWYFQFASSWGQAWSKKQWSGFINWYKQKHDISQNNNIPAYVHSWSEKSWLKYNIAYLIDKNLYFLYPKLSLTSNFSDAGTHVWEDITVYQVPMDLSKKQKRYDFSELKDATAVYDAFFENRKLAMALSLEVKELTVDLNGSKNRTATKYLISSQLFDYKILKSFGRSLKPIEVNILENIEGKELFLYNMEVSEVNPIRGNEKRNLVYNHKHIHFKDALYTVKSEIKGKIQRIFKSLFRK